MLCGTSGFGENGRQVGLTRAAVRIADLERGARGIGGREPHHDAVSQRGPRSARSRRDFREVTKTLALSSTSLLQLVAADALVEADGGHTTQFLAV